MKKLIYTLFFSLSAMICFGQTAVSGTVTDGNEPLIGASVMVKGTSMGTVTDIDGGFDLGNVPVGEQTLVISYIGYATKSMKFSSNGGAMTMDKIKLEAGGVGLDAVVVTGVMDIVRDRRTPVAVSTITTSEILAKGGNVEFPDLMKSTPSIYVAGQAGGFGDSEVFTRGFDQTNTAFLLNGQPINGMEDGKMYWSNWSGMSDVATAIQVQRGLGSSKLAISSVGGTTNIIMKPTEQKQGGTVSYLYGNDNYNKITASYNTGMIDDKFGVTMLLTHWQGDGWAEGTRGQGQNYFISAGYKASEKHMFNFLLTGAPQWHDQNFNSRISDHFDEAGEFNIKHNGNWGTLGGEYFTSRRNYYHKPVANLNWEYAINDDSKLSTVLYGSWGRGGGSGGIGNSANRKFTDDGQWDFDAIVAANTESAAAGGDGNEYVLRNSVNNHSWYGLVTNYETILSSDLTFSFGGDFRSYRGSHFREVRDLLGASAYSTFRTSERFGPREITAEFSADPWAGLSSFAAPNERIQYNNDETIRYAGIFGQLEYSKESFSGYVQGALSNQSHVRFEIYNETEANERSEKVSNLGYNLKTGFSLELNENSNFFVNTGFYQRQPFHDNIYLNFSNFVNPVTVPEKVFGLEAGYKYATRDFALNLNVYRTSWKDRATTNSLREGDILPNGIVVGDTDVFQNAIQDQLHTGLEIDFSYDVNSKFRLKGFGSIGNWKYNGDIRSQYFNDDRELILENTGELIDGVKVGGAAQTTFGLGADYKIGKSFRIDVDYNHYANLYARVSADRGELKLPSFGLFDLGLSYRINMADDKLMNFRVNVYNLLGTEYISRATTTNAASTTESENWNGVNVSNRVQFGKTRTWNVSARYSF